MKLFKKLNVLQAMTLMPKIRCSQWAALFVGGLLSSTMWAQANKIESSPLEFKLEAQALCSGPDKVRKKMPDFKQQVLDYMGRLDRKTFIEKLEHNEAQLMLISSLWPELMAVHLETHATYARCAAIHQDIISLRGKIKKDRLKAKVEDWKNCLSATYGEMNPLPQEIASLLECYSK